MKDDRYWECKIITVKPDREAYVINMFRVDDYYDFNLLCTSEDAELYSPGDVIFYDSWISDISKKECNP